MMILCKGLICGVLTVLIFILVLEILPMEVESCLNGFGFRSIKEIAEDFELEMQQTYGWDKTDTYKNSAIGCITTIICGAISVILYNLIF